MNPYPGSARASGSMGRPEAALCLDLGSAYTKIGFRESGGTRTRLLRTEGGGGEDEGVCIPSVAAWRERDDRWVFGAEAADLVEGNGIRVFRNWKQDLFPAGGRGGGRRRPALPAEPTEREERQALGSGPGSYLRARTVARRFLGWLRSEVVPPRVPGFDPGRTAARLCVPDFALFTPQAMDLDRLMESVGWGGRAPRGCSEPLANVTGVLTDGRNAVMEPEPGSGRWFANLPDMFRPGHVRSVTQVSRAGREGDGEEHSTLVVDIGAYTTDFALLSVDVSRRGVFPLSETGSSPLGIHELDRRLREAVPPRLGAQLERLSGREWERLHRVVYGERREWELPGGGGTIGRGPDAQAAVGRVLARFGLEVAAAMTGFLDRHRPPCIQEVILTGGGNRIPELSGVLRHALAGRRVTVFYLPRAGTGNRCGAEEMELSSELIRGASAIGGASVVFDAG